MTRFSLRDSAGVTVGALSAALLFAAPGHAIDDCGVGMYYNNAIGQCEPWAPVGVDFAPAVGGPAFNPVPIGVGFDPLPVGIGFDVDFGWNVPNIAPYLRVPALPGVVHGPGIFGPPRPIGPDLRVPDVRVPPAVRVPDVRVPEVRIPEVHAPEVHRR